MDYKKITMVVLIAVVSLVGFKKRHEVMAARSAPVVVHQIKKQEILSPEEIAEVKAQQELVLKEAENLKIKEKLLAEKKQMLSEYETKISNVENELSTIRGNKLSFQSRLRQAASQGPSTEQNVDIQVSVLGKEDLEKLGIIR